MVVCAEIALTLMYSYIKLTLYIYIFNIHHHQEIQDHHHPLLHIQRIQQYGVGLYTNTCSSTLISMSVQTVGECASMCQMLSPRLAINWQLTAVCGHNEHDVIESRAGKHQGGPQSPKSFPPSSNKRTSALDHGH